MTQKVYYIVIYRGSFTPITAVEYKDKPSEKDIVNELKKNNGVSAVIEERYKLS